MPFKNKADRKEYDRLRRVSISAIIEEWFHTHPCVDCGNSDRRVLEPDHVRGKNFIIGACRLKTATQVMAELNLCDSRCANCHKIRHWDERAKGRATL